jgi:hypothetical protein
MFVTEPQSVGSLGFESDDCNGNWITHKSDTLVGPQFTIVLNTQLCTKPDRATRQFLFIQHMLGLLILEYPTQVPNSELGGSCGQPCQYKSEMADNLNFCLKMEDDLNFVQNGRRPQF